MNTEKTYSLEEATTITGFSKTKFRYNRELLTNNGATITPTGWTIPHSTLEQLGWVGKKPMKVRALRPTIKEHEKALGEITRLRARVEELESSVRARKGLFSRRSRP